MILAPAGRDAYIASAILGAADIQSASCSSLSALVDELRAGAGFAVVTSEALMSADLSSLRNWIDAQPEWSDFPFILLVPSAGGLERNPEAARQLKLLNNVTFLERPFHPVTLVSLAQAALRGRRRQYEARARMKELHELAGSLERQVEERTAELLKGEQALRRSEQLFRLLVQGVTDYAIYMLDPQGYVSSWNIGAERIKGYTPAEIIGQHFSRFYTEEEREMGLPARALEIARVHRRFMAEGWRIRKDGSRFRAHVVIDPIHDDSGELIGFTKITRDVTELVETQRGLEQAQEALFQSQKMEAIGQLTGGIAHDFNNLLMAVLSSMALLKKRLPDDPQIMKLLNNAVQGAERGAVLTQRMLAFARRQEMKTERIDIPALVHGMAELLQRSLGPSWTIDTYFPLNLSIVMADANQLEMALLNLVVNARDAMADGGVVKIKAREAALTQGEVNGLPEGHYVCLSVIDTGTGMDPETLNRAMEPFFTTKGIGKGTGLGLSMVHGIAKQLGGAFVLKSEPDQGTTAELWLPAAEIFPDTHVKNESVQPAVPGSRPLVILAVDDDVLVLMNTAALLEDLGHTVIEAGSGKEALALFRQRQDIDLVITDQAMPGMTGVELASAIKSERPQTPIVLATGYGELPADADSSIHRLGKPYTQAELARTVAEAVRRYNPAAIECQ